MLIAALLRKNLRQSAWLGPLFVMLASGVSAWALSDELRYPWTLMVVFLPAGVILGAAVFLQDLQRGGVAFLETLPVRRWDVWWSNYLEGLLALAGVTACVALGVTIGDPPATPGYSSLWVQPTTLEHIAGGLGPGLAIFSVTVLARTWTQAAAALYAPVVGACAAGWFAFLIGQSELSPSPLDLLPAFLVLSALASAASLGLFLRFPSNRSREHHRVLGWTGALAVVLAAAAGFVWGGGLRWKELALDPRTSVEEVKLASDGSLLLRVEGARSGHHLLRIDAGERSVEELGRGFSLLGATAQELFFETTIAPGAVFAGSRQVHAYPLPTGPLSPPLAFGGSVSDPRASERFVASTRVDAATKQREVVVVDRRSGREQRVGGGYGYVMSANGRLLLRAIPGLVLFDPNTGHRADVKPDGLVAVDPAFRRGVVFREGGFEPRAHSLSVLDLETGSQREVVSPDDPLALGLIPPPQDRPWWRTDTFDERLDEVLALRRPLGSFAFDREVRSMVAVVRERGGSSIGFSVQTLDLESGATRVAIPADALPRFDAEDAPRALVLAVSADGTRVGFTIGGGVFGADLSKGTVWRSALDGAPNGDLHFDPSFTRAVDGSRSNGAEPPTLAVHSAGGVRTFPLPPQARFHCWRDATHALVSARDELLSIDVTDGAPRVVYPRR